MIKTFENYKDDILNKEAIDSASYIESSWPNGDKYQHYLQFVLPYHENEVTFGKSYTLKGSAYEIRKSKSTFGKFESEIRFGGGKLMRSVSKPGIAYDGKVMHEYDFGNLLVLSKKENKPLYSLIYVTIKNGIKRYSEKGLEELKAEYPEFLYNK